MNIPTYFKSTFILRGTITAETPLATCSKDLNDKEGGDRLPTPIPHTPTAKGDRLYFPATGLRGAWRRACRDAIRNRVITLTGDAKPWTLDEHYLHTLGGIKGKGETMRHTVADEEHWRKANPLLSLFGAGDAGYLGFVAGRVSISNAICESASKDSAAVFAGVRTDDVYRDKTQVAYLSDADIQMLISRSKGGRDTSLIKAEIKTITKEHTAAKRAGEQEKADQLSEKLKQLTAEEASVKEATGASDNAVGMPLAGYRAIPQGEKMAHRIVLNQVTDIELGLMLAGLKVFALDPTIGAHTAHGCGLISAEWEVSKVTENGAVPIGTVRLEPYDALILEGEPLIEALSRFEQFMNSKEWNFAIPNDTKHSAEA